MIKKETLRNKMVEGAKPKFPVTDVLFKTMREYCEEEEITEFDRLQNIIIMGGGANINIYDEYGRDSNKHTLGSLMVHDIKRAISSESVTGLNVILSMDPRLAVLQGGKIMMNLSSDQRHYVSSHDYFEQGPVRKNLINQILL